MANTITNVTLFNGNNRIVKQYTVVGDGATQEADTIIIDKSALTGPDGVAPSKLSLREVVWNISADGVALVEWDRDTDVLIGEYSKDGAFSYMEVGGKHDTGTGGTGDVVITTIGLAANEVADFIFDFKKKQ